MAENSEWGPLAALIGEWEGDEGLDVSYHNVEGEVGETPYREKVTMKPASGYQRNETEVKKQTLIAAATPANQPRIAPRAVARLPHIPKRNIPSSGPPASPIALFVASTSVPSL